MQTAKTVKCSGEAHSNPYIDNCGCCLYHHWEHLFCCPNCPTTDRDRPPILKMSKSGKTGKCLSCRKMYNTDFNPSLTEDLRAFGTL